MTLAEAMQGSTNREIAERMQTVPAVVSRWRSGARFPSRKNRIALGNALADLQGLRSVAAREQVIEMCANAKHEKKSRGV